MNTHNETHPQDPVVLHHGVLERGSLTSYKEILMIGHMDKNGYLYKLEITLANTKEKRTSLHSDIVTLQPPRELVKLDLLSGTFI